MQIWSLVKKELNDYFISPVAYIILSLFAIGVGAYWMKDLFLYNQSEMRTVFEIIPLVFIVFIPAITMSSWAEEKQEGTYELLLTMPINRWQLVLAKFLSSFIFSIVLILTTLPIVLVLNLIGNPNNGIIVSSYIALLFLTAAYVAIGQFISVNSNNQIGALLISIALIGLFYMFGENFFLELVPMKDFFSYLGLGSHFRSIAKGVLDSRDIVYYLSLIGLFQFLVYTTLIRITKKGK